jgi:hypothetical protein
MEETLRLVNRYGVFMDPADALPLRECCFYHVLAAMIDHRNSIMEAYCEEDKAFAQLVRQMHELDVATLTAEQQQIVIKYAIRFKRCDCIDAWISTLRGDELWLNDGFRYSGSLISVLEKLLDSGRPSKKALTELIRHSETWQFVVHHIWCPLVEATSGHEPAEFWQYCAEAIGPHALDDPELVHRALNIFYPNTVPTIWKYISNKARALDYVGEIGSTRELFGLRHIYGLEELPPPPSDAPVLASIFRGECTVSMDQLRACAHIPDLAAHVRFCFFRRNSEPILMRHLSDLLVGYGPILYDLLEARLEVAPRSEIQYALLAYKNLHMLHTYPLYFRVALLHKLNS